MHARKQSHACACLVSSINTVSICCQEVESLLKQLSFVPGFAFTKDVSYIGFLDRVHEEDTKQSSTEHEDVLHPWFNLFLPKSRIRDFESAVFKGILKNNNPVGLVLIYPFNKNKYVELSSTLAKKTKDDIFHACMTVLQVGR